MDGSLDETRVIVVDDEVEVAEVLAELLSFNGYRVQTAADGEAALTLAATFQPHCMLLDIRMKGMGGLELTRRMRADYGDDVVLIAISGAGSDSPDTREAFALVDHFLLKPLDIAELERILPPMHA